MQTQAGCESLLIRILRSWLSSVLQALKEDGAYIINDPKGAPTPAANIRHNPAAAAFYGFSCHTCLPSGA